LKKILFVLDTFPTLSETFLYTLLENLSSQYELIICARRKGESPHRLSFESKVIYLPKENHLSLVKLIIWFFYLLRNLFSNPVKTIKFIQYIRFQFKNNFKVIFIESFKIFPLLLIKKNLTYFSFGGLAVKYLEYIKFEENCFFSLRGTDINIEPVVNDHYKSRLKEAIINATGVHSVCNDIKQKAETLIGQKSEKIRTI